MALKLLKFPKSSPMWQDSQSTLCGTIAYILYRVSKELEELRLMVNPSSQNRSVGLRDRLKRHFLTCSATAAAALAWSDKAEAGIVYWNSTNDPDLPRAVAANIYGVYINPLTGAAKNGSLGNNPPIGMPFINLYAATGTTIDAIYTAPQASFRMVTTLPNGTVVAGLALGTLISGASNFAGTAVNVTGTNALTNPGTTILGFKFLVGAQTDYGWVRITGTGPNAKTVIDFAYENTGAAIAAGATGQAVPEPSSISLGLLALGCVGVAALRSRRATTQAPEDVAKVA